MKGSGDEGGLDGWGGEEGGEIMEPSESRTNSLSGQGATEAASVVGMVPARIFSSVVGER